MREIILHDIGPSHLCDIERVDREAVGLRVEWSFNSISSRFSEIWGDNPVASLT